MASYSIQTRTLASGEKRYKATITVKSNGRIVHRFAKTHKKKAIATAWAKNQVSEIETKGVNTQRATTLAELQIYLWPSEICGITLGVPSNM